MKEPRSINYIYFGLFFLIISFIHIYHLFLIEDATAIQRCFYILHALGQCLLEVTALVTLYHFVTKFFPRGFPTLFILLSFFFFLIHLIDFPLVRIMGMSIWYVMDWIQAESLENFIELLYATHISMTSWMIAAFAAIILPLIGILFFHFTNKISKRRPLYFSSSFVGFSILSVILFLSFFDLKIFQIKFPFDEVKFFQALPWKTTLFPEKRPKVEIGHLQTRPSEISILTEIYGKNLTLEKKPPVFLFIIESLRDDFLTNETAPNLARFRENYVSFRHSLAAANGTHLSWFSIFHSVYPFYWDERNPQDWRAGSIPLQILKKAGYKVRLYSASRLRFYQMDDRIFGRQRHIADEYTIFGHGEKENHEKDALCIETLLKDIETHQEGNVFIVFLESTHFGYSWPLHQSLCSAPAMDYLNIACSNQGVDGVKNRYRNAIHFLDALFGSFINKLKSLPIYKDSLIVVTGDHGEEFFEEGRIFHTSNLNTMQTHVPIYYKIGENHFQKELSSHLDIFPTIIDHVLGSHHFDTWFDGESILKDKKKNFAITARYNASRTPYEFLLHDGKHQLIARFDNKIDVLSSKNLELISMSDEKDKLQVVTTKKVQEHFKPALDTLFKK